MALAVNGDPRGVVAQFGLTLPCSKAAKLPCKLQRTSLAVYVEILFFFFEQQRETISAMNYSSVLTSRAVYTFLDD